MESTTSFYGLWKASEVESVYHLIIGEITGQSNHFMSCWGQNIKGRETAATIEMQQP